MNQIDSKDDLARLIIMFVDILISIGLTIWFPKNVLDLLIRGVLVLVFIVALLRFIRKKNISRKYFWPLAIFLLVTYFFFVGSIRGQLVPPNAKLSMGIFPTIEYPEDPTNTIIPTNTLPPTNTILPTNTPRPPCTKCPTEVATTVVPTTTPDVYFEDPFNRNDRGWNLNESYTANVLYAEKNISDGKLKYKLHCYRGENEKRSDSTICQDRIKVPDVTLLNFDVEFETKFVEYSSIYHGAVGITVRGLNSRNLYTFLISSAGKYKAFISTRESGLDILRNEQNVIEINSGLEGENKLFFAFQDNQIVVKVNDVKIDVIDGRSIYERGEIFLTLYTEGRNNIGVEIDNLLITSNQELN